MDQLRFANFKTLSLEEGFNSISQNRVPESKTKRLDEVLGILDNKDVTLDKIFEFCEDIRPVLSKIRDVLISGNKVSVIAGYRNGCWRWDEASFREVLESSGIIVTDSKTLSDSRFKLSLGCTQTSYDDFLDQNSLPHAHIQHLLVSTEHADYRVTGGIGSYTKECDVLYGEDIAVLILDSNADINLDKIRATRWLAAQQFLSIDRIEIIEKANFDTVGDLVLEVIESLLCLYPHLKSIESQEMLLHRVIEAKKIGFIPKDIKLITTCHGSSFHLAKAKRNVIDAENIHVAYREKFTIEESDCVIFPTRFLRDSYQESGVKIDNGPSRIIKRLPFDTRRLPEGKKLTEYRRIIYIGKTSTIKGFDLFLETLLEMEKKHPKLKSRIEEVIVMATTTKIEESNLQDMFRRVESSFNIRMVSLDREKLLKLLAEYSEDSLALITYRGDNHPLTILELMGVGHDFIAANAAGTPELILPGTEADYLIKPDAGAFADAVNTIFTQAKKRSRKIQETSREYRKQQENINKSYTIADIGKMPVYAGETEVSTEPVHVSIVKGVGSDKDIEKTRRSLDAQTTPVADTKIIDEETIPSVGSNGFQIRLYAGDVLYPTAIENMLALISSDEDCGGVMVYEDVPAYLGIKLKGITEFHPFAPELGSVFLQERFSRRVVVLFKNSHLDDTYTDWLKTINLACSGKTIRIVPRKLASLTEIDAYPATDLLHISRHFANSFTCLPVFDATILFAEMKRFDDIYWGQNLLNHLQNTYIRRDDPSISYDVSPTLMRVAQWYETYVPKFVLRVMYLGAKAAYSVPRMFKKS